MLIHLKSGNIWIKTNHLKFLEGTLLISKMVMKNIRFL